MLGQHGYFREHDSFVSKRCAMVGTVPPTRVTMQECSLSLFGETGRKVTLKLGCGRVVKLVQERSVYRGGQ
jgi:hypothetical protein